MYIIIKNELYGFIILYKTINVINNVIEKSSIAHGHWMSI